MVHLPLSDPENEGGWVPFEQMTDEFQQELQEDGPRWQIGTGTNWIGSVPVHHDHPGSVEVRDKNLLLHLLDRDPADETAGEDKWTYTSGYIMSRVSRRYGYFEVKMQAAVASVTSTFWLKGGSKTYNREIDIFETPSAKPTHLHKMGINFHRQHTPTLDRGVIDGPPRPNGVKLPFKPIEGLHTYALEWDMEKCKIYADGQLVREVTTDSWKVGMRMFAGISWNPSFFPEMDASMVPAVMTVEHIRSWVKPPTNDVRFVDLHGSDHNDGTTWDSAYRTIQHAIDNTYDGGQIFIAQGEYAQDITMTGIHKMSLWGGCATGQPANSEDRPEGAKTTIMPLKGNGARQPLILTSCFDCVVDGFLLKGTKTTNCHGISVSNGYGGTIISNCDIEGNYPDGGPGAAISVGGSCLLGHVEFINCNVSRNKTAGKYAWAGGVVLNEREGPRIVHAKFKRCTFEGNQSKEHSACLFMSGKVNPQSSVELLGCGIFNNSHTEHENPKRRVRAAIVMRGGKLIMKDCFMKSNSEVAVQIMDDAVAPDIERCHFSSSPQMALQFKVDMDEGSLKECVFSKNPNGSIWYKRKRIHDLAELESHLPFATGRGNRFSEDETEDPRVNYAG